MPRISFRGTVKYLFGVFWIWTTAVAIGRQIFGCLKRKDRKAQGSGVVGFEVFLISPLLEERGFYLRETASFPAILCPLFNWKHQFVQETLWKRDWEDCKIQIMSFMIVCSWYSREATLMKYNSMNVLSTWKAGTAPRPTSILRATGNQRLLREIIFPRHDLP